MPVPKRRTSRSMRNSRRGHIKIKVPFCIRCAQCSESVLPHRVCSACGYYKGVQVTKAAE